MSSGSKDMKTLRAECVNWSTPIPVSHSFLLYFTATKLGLRQEPFPPRSQSCRLFVSSIDSNPIQLVHQE